MSAERKPVDFGVPAYLSFDRENQRNASGRMVPGLKLGRGEAGWTVYRFATAAEALSFAEALPPECRMPSYSRSIAELRAAAGAAA